ncbi:MAG: hypothetical protein Q4G42_08325 [Neisseria sp.]|nr:hypothetical protein [Neisseria sp.]
MSIKTTVLTLFLLSASAMVAAAPYSQQTREQYLAGCTQVLQQDAETAAISNEYCGCTLDKLEKKLTEKEFLAAGEKLDSTPDSAVVKKFNKVADEAVDVCAKEIFNL